MDENLYLIIGIEDGWIHVDNTVWEEYLKIKEQLANEIKRIK